MEAMLKLVIFDLAGTTVKDNDEVLACFLDAMKAAGLAADPAEVNQRMGIPKREAIRQVFPALPPEEVEAVHQDFRNRMIDYYRHSPQVAEIEGAEVLVRALQAKGVKVGFDTGFDRETADVLFARLGWKDLADATATSDEVANGRPAPDLALRIMSLTGVTDPLTVAKIGDTPSDLGEGTSAGCAWVVGVTYGTHTREALLPHKHTHLVDSLGELSELLLGV